MQQLSWYLSLILFTVSTCGSPGPNNLMVMSSGVNYGIRRSWSHVIGINVGFPLMVVAVGIGLGGVLHRFPVLLDLLRPLGVAYLLYLAYQIMSAPTDGGATTEAAAKARDRKPLTVLQAALFQMVNPKAWVMIVGALVTYGTGTDFLLAEILLIALIFFLFGTPCTIVWLWLGASLKKLLARPALQRGFNIAMAALLVLSVVPTIGEVYRSLR
ncbi:MAG TPA: LysE family translocator [Micromonosporaceae bacterium]|jgi:threonine/homoserine/homoserine lactone efflux protein